MNVNLALSLLIMSVLAQHALRIGSLIILPIDAKTLFAKLKPVQNARLVVYSDVISAKMSMYIKAGPRDAFLIKAVELMAASTVKMITNDVIHVHLAYGMMSLTTDALMVHVKLKVVQIVQLMVPLLVQLVLLDISKQVMFHVLLAKQMDVLTAQMMQLLANSVRMAENLKMEFVKDAVKIYVLTVTQKLISAISVFLVTIWALMAQHVWPAQMGAPSAVGQIHACNVTQSSTLGSNLLMENASVTQHAAGSH